MDRIFWAGIGIGALLSFLAAIAANLLNNKIVDFLERGKLVSKQHSRMKAERFYKLVRDLHTGKRDKYLYMVQLSMIAIGAFVASCTLMILSVVLLAPKLEHLGPLEFLPLSEYSVRIYFLSFAAYLNLFVTFQATRRYRDIHQSLDNFAALEEDYRRRWGELPQ